MKSAFLIVAHGNFDMLKYLIRALDYKNNDIYIHIDKKCGNIDISQFQNITKYSKVEFLKNRIRVFWGGIYHPFFDGFLGKFLVQRDLMCYS